MQAGSSWAIAAVNESTLDARKEWVHGPLFTTGWGINGLNTIPGEGKFDRCWSEVGFSSYHPGGCHFLQVDGSTRFLLESIDAATLEALTTRKGGEAFSDP